MMDGMSKRSTRMAKREDFQNELRAVEEAIGSSVRKSPAAAAQDPPTGLKGGKARAEKRSVPQKKK